MTGTHDQQGSTRVGRSRLLAIDDDDAVTLMAGLASQPSNSGRYRGLDRVSSPSVVRQTTLDGTVLTGAIVMVDLDSDRVSPAVGLVQVFAMNLVHGTAQLGVILDQRVQMTGWPFEAVLEAVDVTFSRFPLRQLYLEVSDHHDSMKVTLDRITDSRAVLSQHEFYDGKYWDVTIYRIDRTTYRETTKRILGRGDQEQSWTDAASLDEFDRSVAAAFSLTPSSNAPAVPLVERGLDSLSILELLTSLEERTGLPVSDGAITPELTTADLYHWFFRN